MTTGQLLKDLRLKKGLTQEELSSRTGISVRTIQRIEKDEVEARAYTLQVLATQLEVEFEKINPTNRINPEHEIEKESRFWLPLLHLSGLFLTLIPPVIIWLLKKDVIKNMREHGINVINFQLSMLLILVPSSILAVLIITIPIIIFVAIFSSVIIIINTIKVMNNQPYKYPMTIKFLDL